MMRRATALALAAALLGGLLAIPAGPAGAQNGDSLLDAPRLGFEIDPDRGYPGDVLEVNVDPDDVAAECITTPEELLPYIFADSGISDFAYLDPGPWYWEYIQRADLIGIEIPDEWPTNFFGVAFPPPAGVDDLVWTWYLYFTGFGLRDTVEQTAASVLWVFLDLLQGGLTDAAYDAYLTETFVLTFVDPINQTLEGSTSTFDPATGSGTLHTPELPSGLWAVAAACVEPKITDESFMNAIAAGANWLIDNDVPSDANIATYNGSGWLIENVAPVMLEELMVPRALGIQFYCILQPDGFCATPPGPVELIDEEVIGEFNGDEAGDDAPAPEAEALDDLAEVEDLVAVQATPSFTG